MTSVLEKVIKPKFKILRDMGFSNNDIADMIASNASILHRSVSNTVIPAISVLRGLLGSDAEVVKLLMKCGWFIIMDFEKSILPNIRLFQSLDIPMEQIIRRIHSFLRLFLQKPERVRKYADKAAEMGVKPSSRMFIHAVHAIGSMNDKTGELKLQAFRSLGFSEDDILNAFKKRPPAFAVSVEKMKKVTDLLISSGKYDMACIVDHPQTLMASIEKRYKPRLQVLATLESKNLIEKWPSVTTLCSTSNDRFYDTFVNPYTDDVGHLFDR